MNIVLWTSIAITLVLATASITSGGTKVNEKELAKLVRKLGLPLPPALRTPVLTRIRSRERSALTWGLAAVALGAVVTVLVEIVTGSDAVGPLLVMMAAALGTSIGSYRGCVNAPDTLDPEAPRVARAHSIELADYSTREERWAARLVPPVIGLALATTLVVWLLVPVEPAGGLFVPSLAALGSIAVAGVSWILARARVSVVERAQHANNDLELAWDDALRTMAVRDLQDSAISSGMLATFGLLVMAGSWVTPWEVRAGAETLTLALGSAAFVTGLVCWGVLLILWLLGREERNPSLHLWTGKRFRVA